MKVTHYKTPVPPSPQRRPHTQPLKVQILKKPNQQNRTYITHLPLSMIQSKSKAQFIKSLCKLMGLLYLLYTLAAPKKVIYLLWDFQSLPFPQDQTAPFNHQCLTLPHHPLPLTGHNRAHRGQPSLPPPLLQYGTPTGTRHLHR